MYNLDYEIVKVNDYILNHKQQFNKEIGQKIKKIRMGKNITIEKLSQNSLLNPNYFTQIEKGVHGLTLNKFIVISNSLKVEPQKILEDFIFTDEISENVLYKELQEEKNLSSNILNYMKNKSIIQKP